MNDVMNLERAKGTYETNHTSITLTMLLFSYTDCDCYPQGE